MSASRRDLIAKGLEIEAQLPGIRFFFAQAYFPLYDVKPFLEFILPCGKRLRAMVSDDGDLLDRSQLETAYRASKQIVDNYVPQPVVRQPIDYPVLSSRCES